MSPAEIAKRVTLLDAAVATTPRPVDVLGRAADALHEAHHVVLDALMGYRTLYIYTPMRDMTGALVPNIGSLRSANGASACTVQARDQREDIVSLLEDAVSRRAGHLAELILTGDKLPVVPEGAFSDHNYAIAKIELHQRGLAQLLAPYHERRFGKITDKVNAELFKGMVKWHHRRVLRTAKALVAQHYLTIDAAATIILMDGRNGGLCWSNEHHDWLIGQIETPQEARNSAGRMPYVECPAWLAKAAKTIPIDFVATRRIVASLEVGLPSFTNVDLLGEDWPTQQNMA